MANQLPFPHRYDTLTVRVIFPMREYRCVAKMRDWTFAVTTKNTVNVTARRPDDGVAVFESDFPDFVATLEDAPPPPKGHRWELRVTSHYVEPPAKGYLVLWAVAVPVLPLAVE